jgi:TatA/E family protein of Tat protein translocase
VIELPITSIFLTEPRKKMGSFGWQEMLIILVIALIIFGPRKLPELGKTLGESLAQFRRASEDFKRTWESEVEYEKARIDAPKPADTSYSYSTDSSTAASVGTSPPGEATSPVAPPEGTVPAHDGTSQPAATEPASAQPASTQTKRDWM